VPDQIATGILDAEVLDAFHRFYYGEAFRVPGTDHKGDRVWHRPMTDVMWLGTRAQKCPFDLFVFQEILWDTRPDLIFECGTSAGGTTLFLASICELIRHGVIVTIDKVRYQERSYHPLILWWVGDTLSKEVLDPATEAASHAEKVMVILDDDHSRDHVLEEMEVYGRLVKGGCYMVVEDSNVNGHPVFPEHGPGPHEAIEEFMRRHGDEWEQDRSREHFGVTYNPGGYLKRRQNARSS